MIIKGVTAAPDLDYQPASSLGPLQGQRINALPPDAVELSAGKSVLDATYHALQERAAALGADAATAPAGAEPNEALIAMQTRAAPVFARQPINDATVVSQTSGSHYRGDEIVARTTLPLQSLGVAPSIAAAAASAAGPQAVPGNGASVAAEPGVVADFPSAIDVLPPVTAPTTKPPAISDWDTVVVPTVITEAWNEGARSDEELAFFLATAHIETGREQAPYGNYEDISQAEANRQYDTNPYLGNRPGTNDGYDYRGRGVVQLTGRGNYQKFGELLGLNLVASPDLVADPAISARILIQGSLGGLFTGTGLKYWENKDAGKSEQFFADARNIINPGADSKELKAFAALGEHYLAAVQSGQYNAILAPLIDSQGGLKPGTVIANASPSPPAIGGGIAGAIAITGSGGDSSAPESGAPDSSNGTSGASGSKAAVNADAPADSGISGNSGTSAVTSANAGGSVDGSSGGAGGNVSSGIADGTSGTGGGGAAGSIAGAGSATHDAAGGSGTVGTAVEGGGGASNATSGAGGSVATNPSIWDGNGNPVGFDPTSGGPFKYYTQATGSGSANGSSTSGWIDGNGKPWPVDSSGQPVGPDSSQLSQGQYGWGGGNGSVSNGQAPPAASPTTTQPSTSSDAGDVRDQASPPTDGMNAGPSDPSSAPANATGDPSPGGSDGGFSGDSGAIGGSGDAGVDGDGGGDGSALIKM